VTYEQRLRQEYAAVRARLMPQARPVQRRLPPPKPVPQLHVRTIPNPLGIRWRDIVNEVALKHEIDADLIWSERRFRGLIAAKHEVFYRISVETGATLSQIGRWMGRDHTSIMNGIFRHKERMRGK
jgi:hypothetical protein